MESKLQDLIGEVFRMCHQTLGGNKYAVVQRIEREVQPEMGMIEPNGKLVELFDSPNKAVKFAQQLFERAYAGKQCEVRRPKTGTPRDVDERRDSAIMTVKVFAEIDGGIDSVKFVVYLMSPRHIAALLVQQEHVFYDLAAFPAEV